MRALSFFAAFAAACATPVSAQTPDWFSGYWLSCENGRQVSETWTGAGMTRTAQGVDFEFLRIATPKRAPSP